MLSAKNITGMYRKIPSSVINWKMLLHNYSSTITSLAIQPYSSSKNITRNKNILPYTNLKPLNLNLKSHNIPSLINVDSKFLYWFAGFVDGEGSFAIYLPKNKNAVRFTLTIQLHIDDILVLQKIQKVLNIGKIITHKNVAIWQVAKHSELVNTLVPILKFTDLHTTKRFDFYDWSKGIELKNNVPSAYKTSDRRLLTPSLLNEIKLLRDSLNKARVSQLALKYPVGSQPMDLLPTINPYWLLGFIEGEGSFSVSAFKNQFKLGQEGFSLPVLLSIERYISDLPKLFDYTTGSPKPKASIAYSEKENYAQLTYSNVDTLFDYILPFLLRLDYFQTRKAIDFKLWAVLLILRKSGIFFLPQGKTLGHILVNSINNRRYTNAIEGIKSAVPQALIESVLALTPPYNMYNGLNHTQHSQKLSGLLRRNKENLLFVYISDGTQVSGSPFNSYLLASSTLNIPRHLLQNWVDVPFPYENKYYLRTKENLDM